MNDESGEPPGHNMDVRPWSVQYTLYPETFITEVVE